jgi:hypothetical protein
LSTQMTIDLKIATQHLYTIFSGYQLGEEIIGCPCCVKEEDKNVLHVKKLNDLSLDDLTLYYFKALTTWGGVNDFKHFLPRILDLLANDTDTIDVLIIFEKLKYAEWSTWDEKEQVAVKAFLLAWWRYSTLSQNNLQGENILYFKEALGDIQPLLNSWEIDIHKASFVNLINYIFNHLQSYKIGKDIDKESYHKLTKWLIQKNDIIETGFYYYAEKQPGFAQTISFCHDIVQQMSVNSST